MKLFLAGTETPYLAYSWLPRSESNVFVSFFKGEAVLARIFKAIPSGPRRGYMTIDSGAHTFFGYMNMSATKHIKLKGSVPDPGAYFARYVDWMLAHRSRFDYAVELDIQEVVGHDRTRQWRQDYERQGLGASVIRVFHSNDGWARWEEMVAESPARYVGIEGLRPNKPMLPYLKFIEYAYKRGCRVHGFAMVKKKILTRFPFYSVDSSSWTCPYRWGKIPTFNERNAELNFLGIDDPKALIPRRIRAVGRAKESWLGVLEKAERQMLTLESYLTEFWRRRGVVWQ
jgi:hypothetical protein